MMIMVRRCALIACVVGLVFLQTACAWFYRRPDTELEAASAAISEAKQACGDVYAAETFQRAQGKLNEANAAADKKEKDAKDLAISAKDLAQRSKDEAATRASEARTEAEKNLSIGRDLIGKISTSLGELGEDEDTVGLFEELSSLRAMEAKISAQLEGAGCDLLRAEEMSKKLVAQADELLAQVQQQIQIREEEKAAKQAAVQQHTVVRGECLWRIAEYPKTYSDPFLWPLIYSANRDQIKDPDLIFPNQIFTIPFGATDEEKGTARRKARTRGHWSLYDGK